MSKMDDLKAGLTRKVGPMPAWAWGVTAAAGIWVVRNFLRQPSSPRATASSETGGLIPGAGTTGIPAQAPNFGAPDGSAESLYVTTLDYSVEGSPGAVLSVIDAIMGETTQSTTDPVGSTTGGPQDYSGANDYPDNWQNVDYEQVTNNAGISVATDQEFQQVIDMYGYSTVEQWVNAMGLTIEQIFQALP